MAVETEVVYVIVFDGYDINSIHGYLKPLKIPPGIAGDQAREREFILGQNGMPHDMAQALVRVELNNGTNGTRSDLDVLVRNHQDILPMIHFPVKR